MRLTLLAVAGLVIGLGVLVEGQTTITPPANKYAPSKDVELGREAADEARKQLPLMHDDAVTSYVSDLGQRLVAAIPPEFQREEFHYTFETVNVRDINAFALPGGPMFVNRGMIEVATTEGEVAGVMAHEISHVVLRHGTAQASKAGKYEAGGIAGAVLGAIIGGPLGNVVAQGTRFGVGAVFLRFSRDYEKQADLEGARIMSRAHYDPREMANMFKTIEKQAGAGGPQWLSDHPNPGNRSEYILKEAEALPISNPIGASAAFDRVREHLQSLPPAPTTEEATKNATTARSSSAATGGTIADTVDAPAIRYVDYTEGNVFRISVPANWRELEGSGSVIFAPNGGFGQLGGHTVFTHGVEVGIVRSSRRDVRTATDDFIDSLARGNPRLSQASDYRAIPFDGRRAIQTSLSNVSEATRKDETIQLITMQMRDGNLFYAIAVAPTADLRDYQDTFQRVLGSIRVRD